MGYPKGSSLELLDGTLKLRHCTTLFSKRFHPWSLPSIGYGSGEQRYFPPGHPLDEGSDTGKRVWLTRKTRPGASYHVIPDPGHPIRGDGKDCAPPSSDGVGGEAGVPRNLFPRLGVG